MIKKNKRPIVREMLKPWPDDELVVSGRIHDIDVLEVEDSLKLSGGVAIRAVEQEESSKK